MRPGPMIRADGTEVGQHNGLVNFTIGQRKGLGIHSLEPLYVIGINAAQNTVVVGTAEELGRSSLTAKRVNWIAGAPPKGHFRAEVKIRYKAAPVGAWVEVLPDSCMRIDFDAPLRDITPGQGAVIYDGDRVLGGGIIERE